MQTSSTIDEVLKRHLAAFRNNDVAALIEDYEEDAIILTPQGKLQGHAAIQTFFSNVFQLFPASSLELNLTQTFEEEEIAYISWTLKSKLADVPIGTDTFGFNNGKIAWQTLAAHILIK